MPPVRTKEERDRQVAAIKVLLEQGKSRSQIGAELGLNKNQVGGLIALHIQGHRPNKKATPQVGEFVPPKSGARPRPSQPYIPADLIPVKTDLSFEPPKGKVNVWNVKICQCRWIDDEGYFCAEPTGSATKSYCPGHQQLLYVKVQPKVRKKCLSYQPRVLEHFA
jgi:hypothetical protein